MSRVGQRPLVSVRVAIAALAALGGLALADPVYRDNTVPGDTDWFTAANWFNPSVPSDVWLPTVNDDVYVGDTGYLATAIVDVAAAGAVVSTLTLGNDPGSSGTLRLQAGGGLTVSNGFTIGNLGTGALVQTGGTLSSLATAVRGTFDQTGGQAGSLYLLVANPLGGEARQSLSGGDLLTSFAFVGLAGVPPEGPPFLPAAGRLDQTDGTHTVTPLDGQGGLAVGALPGGTGAYTLSGAGAQLAAPSVGVGILGGNGTFTHTAGSHLITADGWFGDPGNSSSLPPGLIIGTGLDDGEGTITDPGTGTYQLTGGSLTVRRSPPLGEGAPFGAAFWLGMGGTGTFLLGDASGTGFINETDPPEPTGDEVGVSLLLRPMPSSPADTATFRGWGTVSISGMLLNNGRVVADGYGVDRDLDLRSFSLVTSAAGLEGFPLLQGDGSQAGWYAQNHGRLRLPTYVEGTLALWGTAPVGEEAGGSPVNSLAILFQGTQQVPPLSIALLATDHGDVPPGTTGSILGIWDIQGSLPDGTSADLVFRYDDLLAALMGIAEEQLLVYHFDPDDMAWVPLDTFVDTENHFAIAGGVTSFSPFAIGLNITNREAAIPEPATLALLALAGLGLLARRRTHRPAE